MSYITLWRRNGRRCVLIVGGEKHRFLVCVVDHHRVLREQPVDCPDHAALVSSMWEDQEARSLFGCVPPDCALGATFSGSVVVDD